MNQAGSTHKPPKRTSPPNPPKGKKTLFGHAVDARCDELGITLTQLTQLAQVREDTLTDIRYGRRKPQRRTLTRICEALGWAVESYEQIMSGANPVPLQTPPERHPPAERVEHVLVPTVPAGTGYRTVTKPDGTVDHWLTETVAGEEVSVHMPGRGRDPERLRADLKRVMRHLRAQLEPEED